MHFSIDIFRIIKHKTCETVERSVLNQFLLSFFRQRLTTIETLIVMNQNQILLCNTKYSIFTLSCMFNLREIQAFNLYHVLINRNNA